MQKAAICSRDKRFLFLIGFNFRGTRKQVNLQAIHILPYDIDILKFYQGVHMSSAKIKQMADLNQHINAPLDIRLYISKDPRSQALVTFCQELSQQIPKIQVMQQKADEADAKPELQLGKSIVYRGVPQGNELGAFLDILLKLSKQDHSQAHPEKEADLEIPARLKLYVSGMCTFCPLEVKKAASLALQPSGIHLTIIDAMQFSELAQADTIRSVPTLILDDQFRWTGSVDRQELVNAIQSRDPTQLSRATLEAMIADGNAYRLSDMMLKSDCIIPSFIDLLVHDAFSTRLGAMAVAEEIADRQISLARQMTAPLLGRFDSQTDAVKGDLLYILGLCADREVLDFLDTIATGTIDADVKEAAVDAREAILARHPK